MHEYLFSGKRQGSPFVMAQGVHSEQPLAQKLTLQNLIGRFEIYGIK